MLNSGAPKRFTPMVFISLIAALLITPGLTEAGTRQLAILPQPYIEDNRQRFGNEILQASDLHGITTKENAKEIVRVSQLVFDHYTFSTRAARRPAPAALVDFFDTVPVGYCEVAADVIGQLLGEGYQSSRFNIVSPIKRRPSDVIESNYELFGHTVEQVILERGAVLLDPTYGVVLVTTAAEFDTDVLSKQNFSLFRMHHGDVPNITESEAVNADMLYGNLANFGAFGTAGGDTFVVSFPPITLLPDAQVTLGVRDNNFYDVTAHAGGWGDHIGYWYEKTEHRWGFKIPSEGMYEIELHLLSGDASRVLTAPLNIDVNMENNESLDVQWIGAEGHPHTMRATFRGNGVETLTFTSDKASARKIDQMIIRKL